MNVTEKAQDALARIRVEKERCARELEEQRAALVALESAAGAKILAARVDSDQAAEDKVTAALVAARAKIDANERALAASTAAIRKAQHAVGLARAGDLRAEAARLWKEAQPRLEKAAAMLDALFEYEGVQYVPPAVALPSGALADGSMQRTKTGSTLAEIIEHEREAAHLESVAGETPTASLLCAVPLLWRHLGSSGVLRLGPQLPPVPVKTVTPADVARAYIDGLPMKMKG